MPLFRATTALPGQAAARALRDALDELHPAPLASDLHDHDDGSGLWDAAGLFDGPPDVAGLALLARLHGAPDFTVGKVEDRDWVAQVRAELTPVEAGRFIVYGSHDRAKLTPNRIGLEIEAAQAFGTGHHATTQGCLVALDRLVRRGLAARRIADIGGGTGVLAMAAASVWPATAVAGDIDPLATATARENVAANGLGRRVA
jgi:ribosomal protein L11 methyltransferase